MMLLENQTLLWKDEDTIDFYDVVQPRNFIPRASTVTLTERKTFV